VDLPWNTAILFLPPLSNGDSSSEADASSGDRLLVGTGYQKVRLYDKSKGKRPQVRLREVFFSRNSFFVGAWVIDYGMAAWRGCANTTALSVCPQGLISTLTLPLNLCRWS
jgi:hypothetical protein